MVSANNFVGRNQCPRCAEKGKDNSEDNLAIYGDGHQWCYACGYHVPAPMENRIKTTITAPESNKAPKILALPFDASVNIPTDIEDRLIHWGVTRELAQKHHFMWSNSRQRLIMPVYDVYGQLLMYQERSWDIGLNKYLTYGQSSDIMHVLYPDGCETDKSVVILTEDLVSAIRVSMYKPAMPLWGSDIPLKTIKRLASQFYVVGVWLDPNMRLKAVQDVLRISQYVPAFFVHSHLDPKFYNKEQVKEHIDICGYKMIYKDEEARSWTPKERENNT